MGNETNVNYQNFTNENGSFFAAEAEEPMKIDASVPEGANSHISFPSKSCHHCRVKKKLNCKVFNCVNEYCKLAYCENCLNKHYNIVEEKNISHWTCPKCRKICKCSHCKEKGDNRRKNKQEPKDIFEDPNRKYANDLSDNNSDDAQKGNLKRKRSSSIKQDKGDEYDQILSFIEYNKDHKRKPDDSLVRNFIKSINEVLKHSCEFREYTLQVLASTDAQETIESVVRKLSQNNFSIQDLFLSTTLLRKTPLHVASFYGNSKTVGYIIESAKNEGWFQDLLQTRDAQNNTCYDVATPHIRRILDPYFKKNRNGENGEDSIEYRPFKLINEDMSYQSTSTTVGLIFEDDKENQRDSNGDTVIVSNHPGNHKAAQKRRRPSYAGLERVDRAKKKGEWKPATYTNFLNFLDKDSLIRVQIYNRIGNEANWQKYCEGVNFSSQLDMGDVNFREGIVGSEVNPYYYSLERNNESKDWVEIAPSKQCPEKLGLFSKVPFSKSVTICEYAGTLVPKGFRGHPLVYIRSMDLEIDSLVVGNEVRFMRSSPKPNVHLMTVYSQDGPHVLVCTTNSINPGDEIILDPKCL